jgi:hypothetical protein
MAAPPPGPRPPRTLPTTRTTSAAGVPVRLCLRPPSGVVELVFPLQAVA